MAWIRGVVVGKGSFGTVNLATPLIKPHYTSPSIMAVKSSPLPHSSSLQKEKAILEELQDCPQIVRCFGDDTTNEDGRTLYNVFLEYIDGGTLADRLSRSSSRRLPESHVRRYARSMLKGLDHVHKKGYVHCDIKPRNVLVCSGSDDVRIADFGLAVKVGEKMDDGFCLRGTPLYMAPECVANGVYEPASDVWSLGCVVAEAVGGKPAWGCGKKADVNSVLFQIGFGNELPDIPWELSDDGKDFLGRCLVRDPTKRWTAEMLLNHPFVAEDVVGGDRGVSTERVNASPRSAFDFPPWISVHSSMPSLGPAMDSLVDGFGGELKKLGGPCSSLADRVRQLVTGSPPDSSSWGGDWISVREAEPSVSPMGEGPKEADSLLILLNKMMEDGMREANSNSYQNQEKEESTSPSSADTFKRKSVSSSRLSQFKFNESDRGDSIDHVDNVTEGSACGRRINGGNADRFNNIIFDSSDSLLFSLNSHCYDTSIESEYKYRNLY